LSPALSDFQGSPTLLDVLSDAEECYGFLFASSIGYNFIETYSQSFYTKFYYKYTEKYFSLYHSLYKYDSYLDSKRHSFYISLGSRFYLGNTNHKIVNELNFITGFRYTDWTKFDDITEIDYYGIISKKMFANGIFTEMGFYFGIDYRVGFGIIY